MFHRCARPRRVVVPVAALLLLGCSPPNRQADSIDAAVPDAPSTGGGGGAGGAGGGTGGGAGTGLGGSASGGAGGSLAGTGGTSSITSSGGAVGSGGTGKLDAGPVDPLPPDNTMVCETPPRAVVTVHLETECAFGPTTGACAGNPGGQQGTQLQDSDTTVGYIEGGDALWYSGVAMDGLDTLTFRYSKGVDGGNVEIRLDSATGTLVGTFTPAPSGSWTSWNKATAKLSASTGPHTLYLVAAGSTGGVLNVDWLELSAAASSSAETPIVHVNHVGFDTRGPKHVVVEGPAGLGRFDVVSSTGAAVWCGDMSGGAFADWGSNRTFYSVDFTQLTKPGTYRLQIGGFASPSFDIVDYHLFADTLPSVLDYFKGSRADDADVWAADGNAPFNGSDKRADVRGGWYDASGDISKYLTHLSYANYMNPQQIPLVAWALAWIYDQGGPALAASGKAAGLMAEALWGADYLVRVLDPAGYFYTNVFDGWSGDVNQRKICAFVGDYGGVTSDWQSALREGGGMSIAALARIARWKADGSFASARYLAGAEAAFDHLNTNGVKYADDGKENVIDDYTGLLAASELFATTQKLAYLEAARVRATSLVSRLSAEGYFIADGAARPFWHASDAGLPVVALARYVEIETDAKCLADARAAIAKHLDYLMRVTQAVANPYGYARQHTAATLATFFIPHENETKYWWQGENARLGSLAAAALMGGRAVGASGTKYLDLLRFAGHQLDWILGNNPYDICFLRGFGKNNPPDYCASKQQNGTLVGGIANGITGSNNDGTGIKWLVGANGGCGDEWRWLEQWLPHAAWYAVAVAALARQ